MGTVRLQEQLLKAAPAGANHLSSDPADVSAFGKWINAEEIDVGSVHTIWSGLDHVDATLTIEVSSELIPTDANAIAKAGTQFTLGSASGKNLNSLVSDSMTEKWYRVNYAKGSNTVGTINCFFFGKG